MRYCFILNPAAQRGRAGRHGGALERALLKSGVDFYMEETEAPGHAEHLARRAADRGETVIAVGGDGTIHEVACGLVGTTTTMGVIPAGTGNDFARALAMPSALHDAVQALLAATPRPVDLGKVRWQEDADSRSSASHETVFVNALGVGFDAFAAQRVQRYKRLGGRLAYLAAVLHALWRWRKPEACVEVTVPKEAHDIAGDSLTDGAGDDGAATDRDSSSTTGYPSSRETRIYRKPLFLAEISNGFSVGSGFMLTPDAQLDDGLFDVCLIEHVLARRVVRLLPAALKGGHIGEPEVTIHRLRRLTIRSPVPLPVHADGEVLTSGARMIEAQVLPGELSLLMPLPV